MSYVIVFHELVEKKDFPRLSSVIKMQVKKAIIKKLVEQPEHFGIPLLENLKGYRKLRVGNHRIIFKIKENQVKIFIIEHRSLVYKAVLQRLGL